MIKFRLYYDKDIEEEFLNNMVTKGYAMTRFFLGLYWFEKCEVGEYTYRVDLIADKNTKQKNEFYDLIRETGGELVQTWGIWAFFRKKGIFELYTDVDSQIRQYSKIRNTFLILGILELFITMMQLRDYFHYKSIPGLVMGSLLGLICIVFLYQVHKCNRKINELKNSDK